MEDQRAATLEKTLAAVSSHGGLASTGRASSLGRWVRHGVEIVSLKDEQQENGLGSCFLRRTAFLLVIVSDAESRLAWRFAPTNARPFSCPGDPLLIRLGDSFWLLQTLLPFSFGDARNGVNPNESITLPPLPWIKLSPWVGLLKAAVQVWRTAGLATHSLVMHLLGSAIACRDTFFWSKGLKESGKICRALVPLFSSQTRGVPNAYSQAHEYLEGAAWSCWSSSIVRASLSLLYGEAWNDVKSCQTLPVLRTEVERFQIFVKLISGKTILLWVSALDTGATLKSLIEQRQGYSESSFYLLYEGKTLKVDDRMGVCHIQKNSTIHVMYRLRGGADRNRGTAGPSSYKDAARPKGPKTTTFSPSTTVPMSQPRPYIVEKLDEIPSLEVKNPEVKELFSTLQTHALICRFNGFWPRSYDLHNWVYTNWTIDCQLLLCSKGFFIVQFEKLEECQKVITQGPWFWGRAGLFITPWFPEFDANSMVVTKMPVWVRLPNLPLPFWHHLVLEDIGNLLGTFIKRDPERNEQGLFTYARICVEIDLSKGLPDRIHLQYEKFKWLQILDYENTAFRCRYCYDTGHLQDTCPLAKRHPKKKKGMNTRGKTWQPEYAPQYSEDSEVEESEPEEQLKKEEREENRQNSESMEEKNTPLDPVVDASLVGKTVNPMEEYKGEGTQSAIVIQEKVITSGVKRGHESEKSESDKEQSPKQIPEMVNGRQLVIATTPQGRWVEVKNKKKGKKGKIEAYYKP